MIVLTVMIKDEGERMSVRMSGESHGQTSEDERVLATSVANVVDAFTDATVLPYASPKLMAIVGPYVPLGRTSFWLMVLREWLRDRFGRKPEQLDTTHSVQEFLESLDYEEMRIRK